MMQHIATAKSEVAAFATGAESNSFKGYESNEQFGKLLQDQKSFEEKDVVPFSVIKVDDESESAADNFDDEQKDSHTNAELNLVLTAKHNDTESVSIVSQEWVSLVDDLQKLADVAWSTKQPAVQVTIPMVSEISSSVGSSSKDFISALNSGLDEYKNQLSQGREPGIDLKALVADALAKTTDTGTTAKSPINIEHMGNSVSQALELSQITNRSIEHQHDQFYSAIIRDASQIQGEQSKQIQLNQFESKFEKAINIAKPEGHQQLAEKVRWMVNTKNLVAEIRLDPAELGSVHIKVAVSGESASVNFVVQSQQARDAVDTATPRLREMLAEKGIELGQSSVRQESDGQQGQGNGESAKQGGSGNGDTDNVDVSEQVLAQQKIVNGALGGIDFFV